MQNEKQLIIVSPNSNKIGSIGNWKSIGEFKDTPSADIIQSRQKLDLLGLLENIGAVTFDSNGKLIISSFYTNNSQGNNANLSRLLGFLAEALIVQTCNTCPSKNRQWANYARRFPSGMKNPDSYIDVNQPDDYIALGVGLASSYQSFASRKRFSKTNPFRDICWIHKDDHNIDLLMANPSIKGGGSPAGLQVKVSRGTDGYYVYRSMIVNMYPVPVVYFDIRNDFFYTKQRILKSFEAISKSTKRFICGIDTKILALHFNQYAEGIEQYLIRGRDVDPELHEALLEYSFLLEEVFKGQRKLEDLGQRIPQLNTALGVDCAGEKLNLNRGESIHILTVPY